MDKSLMANLLVHKMREPSIAVCTSVFLQDSSSWGNLGLFARNQSPLFFKINDWALVILKCRHSRNTTFVSLTKCLTCLLLFHPLLRNHKAHIFDTRLSFCWTNFNLWSLCSFLKDDKKQVQPFRHSLWIAFCDFLCGWFGYKLVVLGEN